MNSTFEIKYRDTFDDDVKVIIVTATDIAQAFNWIMGLTDTDKVIGIKQLGEHLDLTKEG